MHAITTTEPATAYLPSRNTLGIPASPETITQSGESGAAFLTTHLLRPCANPTRLALTRVHDLLRTRSNACVLYCSRVGAALHPRAFPVQERALCPSCWRWMLPSSPSLPTPLPSLPSIPPSLSLSLPPSIFQSLSWYFRSGPPLMLPARSALGLAFMGPPVPSSPVIVFIHSSPLPSVPAILLTVEASHAQRYTCSNNLF